MFLMRLSFSYFIQHCAFTSSGVSAACWMGGGGGAACVARPAGPGGASGCCWTEGCGAGSTGGGAAAGAMSAELLPPAQPASNVTAATAISAREILNVTIIRLS